MQQKFNLSESTLWGFIKSKDELFESFESGTVDSAKRKRKRDGTFPELEDGVTLWISKRN